MLPCFGGNRADTLLFQCIRRVPWIEKFFVCPLLCFMHPSYVMPEHLGYFMYSDVFLSALRSYVADIYILPSSVNTAGRRGVLFNHFPVHTHISPFTCSWLKSQNRCANCCCFRAVVPVKQVISRKLTLFLRRYVCPLGFFHRGHRSDFL